MNLIIAKDLEEMSRIAAMELMGWIVKGKTLRINLAITAGKTPERMYQIVTEYLEVGTFDYVHYYNFDEIPTKDGRHITIDDLNRLFFKPCGIPEHQIEWFTEFNYEGYDEKIRADGGLDLVVMGLGPDGHFCGNLPGTFSNFGQGCHHVVRDFEGISDEYVTFGPATVMEARNLLMIVNGKHKAEILKKMIEGPVTEEVPASILKLHPNITVVVDEEAASLLTKSNNVTI